MEVKSSIFKSLVILESVILIYFSLLPASHVPSTGIAAPRLGDVEHFSAYLVYGILLSASFFKKDKKTFVTILLLGAGLALLTEIIQLFVPTRAFDILDLVNDTAGVFAGAIIHIISFKRR